MSAEIETLTRLIESLRDESKVGARRAIAGDALALLSKVADERPPADGKESEQRGYQRGLLDAVKILQHVRHRHEAPLRRAEVGTAFTVLNGVWNYGQFLCSEAESRFTQVALRGGMEGEDA